ncbi:MAG: polymer-forming cytoskeletal protein [Chloroflexi bacterium]|nr:polymer-forming cytoskeletal protein [Chloroflexota bacterium]
MFRRTPPAPPKNGHKNGNGNGNGSGHGHHREEAIATTVKAPVGIETVLGANANFSGTLTANAGVRIDGGFDGSIEIDGPLVIGEGARVVAETIRAKAVSIAGSVKGNITADKVEILSTGRVYGDLTVAAFMTEEGAVLRGSVTMQDEVETADATMPVQAFGGNGHSN